MSSLLYDMILMEADKIIHYKQKELELYYKDKHGNMCLLAEPYEPEVEEVLKTLLKRKKMRYFITFAEGVDAMSNLSLVTNRLLRFIVKNMHYDNTFKGWSMRDIFSGTGINLKYLVTSFSSLLQEDIIRYTTVKGKRVYMVNPIYFYRGSFKSIFFAVKRYESEYPKYVKRAYNKKSK